MYNIPLRTDEIAMMGRILDLVSQLKEEEDEEEEKDAGNGKNVQASYSDWSVQGESSEGDEEEDEEEDEDGAEAEADGYNESDGEGGDYHNNDGAGEEDEKGEDEQDYASVQHTFRVSRGTRLELSEALFQLSIIFWTHQCQARKPAVDLSAIRDDLTCRLPGWCFLEKAENGLTGFYKAIARRAWSSSFRGQALAKTGHWLPGPCQAYLEAGAELTTMIFAAFHLTAGLPSRGPEVTSIRLRNTKLAIRNLFVREGQVLIVLSYNKARASIDHALYTVRYFPNSLCPYVFIYLAYIRLFLDFLASQLQLSQYLSTEFLFPDPDPKHAKRHLTPVQATKALRSLTRSLRTPCTLSLYRQAALAIAKRYISDLMTKRNFYYPSDASTPTRMIAAGVGHHPRTLLTAYAIDTALPARLQSELLEMYRQLSTLWWNWNWRYFRDYYMDRGVAAAASVYDAIRRETEEARKLSQGRAGTEEKKGRYHESQEQVGAETENIRFLPRAIGDLLLTYLALVPPLRQVFLHGEVWRDTAVSSCLRKAYARAEVPQFQVVWWRQAAASIAKEKFGAKERANFDLGEIAAAEEVEDEAAVADLAGMSNRSYRTFNHAYAGSTTLTMSTLLHRAYRASQSWRSLFRVDQLLQEKRPQTVSETQAQGSLNACKKARFRTRPTQKEDGLLTVARRLYN
ncbi:hypothetical protein MRS44_018110 [Fusarium solani]|uniref:uncharacterized protein n=1 Tax=Fusarium solani TaxID=169388 RepID=UPI0032C45839|nr:hypothetical protein MRS44_018110 [Fusarium solani]